MAIAVCIDRLMKSLAAEVQHFNGEVLHVRLFKNDIEPTSETLLADFVECDFGDYVTSAFFEWDYEGIVYVAPHAIATHSPLVWTTNGTSTNQVYGYFVTDSEDTLYYSERFEDGPKEMGTFDGQTLTINPVYTRRSEFNSEP